MFDDCKQIFIDLIYDVKGYVLSHKYSLLIYTLMKILHISSFSQKQAINKEENMSNSLTVFCRNDWIPAAKFPCSIGTVLKKKFF